MKTKSILITLLIFSSLSFTIGQPKSDFDKKPSQSLQVSIYDLGSEKYGNLSLYLDFWASWCGPCKREMPYSQKLKKELNGKDVAFVYISTDNNTDKWKAAIDQLQINGIHYRANPKVRNQIIQRFNLQYIPRYILIDKSGKVVDENANRPSNPQTKQDIEKLL